MRCAADKTNIRAPSISDLDLAISAMMVPILDIETDETEAVRRVRVDVATNRDPSKTFQMSFSLDQILAPT